MPLSDEVPTAPGTAVLRMQRDWMQWRRALSPGVALRAAVPAVVAAGLFKLAISDGGRDPQSLALVQTGLFVATAVYMWFAVVKRVAVMGPLLVLTAAVAVTVPASVRPDSSLREFLLWMTYACLFVLTASTLHTRTAARRFLDTLVFIVGWVALVGFYLFWGANNPGMRWYSTFYWPNPFAAFLLLVIPVELSRLVHARGWREMFVHAAMTVLLGVPFILTYSRGAWLTLAAVLPSALLLFRPPSRLTALARLAGTAIVLVAVAILLTRGSALESSPRAVLGRAVSVANANDNSIQGRLNFWRSGVEMFLDRPLTGIGPGTFAYAHAAYQRDVRHYARDAHSLYVQTAAEMGLLGLITLGALLISLAALGLRTLRRSRATPDYPLVAGVCVGLGAFLLHSALDMNWPFPVNPAMAFALIGVLAAYDRQMHGDVAQQGGARPAGWWRWPALGILIVALAMVQVLRFEQQDLLAARSQTRAQRWAEAAASLEAAARLNPLDPKAPSGLAVARERLGADPRQVSALIQRSMALDSMNAYYVVQLADFIHRVRAADPSARPLVSSLLTRALLLDPYHYPNAYGLLARVYADAGEPQRAERVYEQARARYGRAVVEDGVLRTLLWPGVAALYLEWAQFLVREGRLPAAVAVYMSILDLDTQYVPAYLGGADVLVRQRKVDDAVDLLARGLRNVPASEMLWHRWRERAGGRSSVSPE